MKMKMKTTIIASLAITSLLFAVYQPGDAVTYYGHDGSVDEHMTKKTVKSYAGKPNWWVYTVEICATDRNLSISTVTLKSDIDEKQSSGFKTIKPGDCTVAGAVMKAKDSSTLGATMLEKHEAVQRMQELIDGDNKNMSQKEKSELSRLQSVTGVYLR
jgi:hypothetical protein